MAEYTIDKIEYGSNVYNLESKDLKNLVDGSATGSVRTTGSTAESSSYTMGDHAIAEGFRTEASGDYAHAEGAWSIASGTTSHAEGSSTASGFLSHAEGENTVAIGNNSHAQNYGTIASKHNQTAIGKYNLEDTAIDAANQKAFIIGNGTADDTRSNALTVDWNGKLNLADGIDINNDKKIVLNSNITDTYDETSIYASSYARADHGTTNNLYLKADGYIAFYSGDENNAPTGNMYVFADNISMSQPVSISGRIYTSSYIQAASYIQSGGNVYLPNGNGLAGRNADNSAWIGLAGLGSDNSSLYGYGSYNGNSGTAYYEGNNVNIRAKNNISLGGYEVNSTSKQTLTWNAGTAGTAYLTRWGRVITLVINNPTKLAVGNNTVFTLPSGYRPPYACSIMLIGPVGAISAGGTNLSIRASVNTDGTVGLYNYRSSAINGTTNQSGTLTWVV